MNTKEEAKPRNWFVRHYLVSGFIVVFILPQLIIGIFSSNKEEVVQNQNVPTKTLTEMLQTEVTQFSNTPLNTENLTSIVTVQLQALLYTNLADLITKGEKSTNPEDQKLAGQLKEKVISRQIADFPILRKLYAKVLADNLFNEQIDSVKVSGDNNTTLTFIGSPLVSNKMVSTLAGASSDMVTLLRFKRTEYRWSSNYDYDYKFKTLDNFKDGALVTTEQVKGN